MVAPNITSVGLDRGRCRLVSRGSSCGLSCRDECSHRCGTSDSVDPPCAKQYYRRKTTSAQGAFPFHTVHSERCGDHSTSLISEEILAALIASRSEEIADVVPSSVCTTIMRSLITAGSGMYWAVLLCQSSLLCGSLSRKRRSRSVSLEVMSRRKWKTMLRSSLITVKSVFTNSRSEPSHSLRIGTIHGTGQQGAVGSPDDSGVAEQTELGPGESRHMKQSLRWLIRCPWLSERYSVALTHGDSHIATAG